MKKRLSALLCSSLIGSLCVGLAACAKHDGGDSANAPQTAAKPVCGTHGALAAELVGPVDPFTVYGKVLIQRPAEQQSLTEDESTDELDPVHAPYTRALVNSDDFTLEAGRELGVTLKENCDVRGEISGAIAQSGFESTPSGVRSVVWRLPAAMTAAELREKANADGCVVGVTDAILARTNEAPLGLMDDPLVSQQGHLQWLEAAAADALAFPMVKPVVIAVIDTGIDTTHEDLKGVLWRNPREIPNNGIDDDRNGYIDDVNGYNFVDHNGNPQYSSAVSGNQHGTHVSGLAAAQGGNGIGVTGVMGTSAQIMMLNVFGANSSAYSSDIANAIRYAADNGADVINISLGGDGHSAEYESALAYAMNRGVTVIVAAGNEGAELGPNHFVSPAAYAQQFNGMLAIGSIDSKSGQLSYYSNRSATYVELAAPGAEDARTRLGLLSTWPGSRYARIQGTSMASPVAAGAAAMAIGMLRARGYAPSPATIKLLLQTSSPSLASLSGKIKDGRSLNLKQLTTYIAQNYPLRSGAPMDPGVPGAGCP